MTDPDALFAALDAEGVNYVVIGGFAALMRGGSHVTHDVDIAYERTAHNLTRLCRVLNRFSPQHASLGDLGAPFEVTPRFLKANPQAQFVTSIGAVDVLSEITGFNSFATLTGYAETVVAGGHALRVLSRSGILKAKRALGRPKDLADIRELEALEEIEAIDAAGHTLT